MLRELCLRWAGAWEEDLWGREAQDAFLSRILPGDLESLLCLSWEDLEDLSSHFSREELQARAVLSLLGGRRVLADLGDFFPQGFLTCEEWDVFYRVPLSPPRALPYLLVARSLEEIVQAPLTWEWSLPDGPKKLVALDDLWSFLCGRPATLPLYPLVFDQGRVWLLHARHAVKLPYPDLRLLDTMVYLLDRMDLEDGATVCVDLQQKLYCYGLPDSLRGWEEMLRSGIHPLLNYQRRWEMDGWTVVSSRPLSRSQCVAIIQSYRRLQSCPDISPDLLDVPPVVQVDFGGPLRAEAGRLVLPHLARTTPHGSPFRGLILKSLWNWAKAELKSLWRTT